MSSGISVALDEITPLLQRVQSAAAAEGLGLVAGRAVAGIVKEHLYGLDRQRHRGGRHFYRQAGDSVTVGRVPGGARVSVTQLGFRQRYYGGTIRPRFAKMLAIPAAPEAQGMSPREFPDLEVRRVEDPKTGALRLALVRRASTQIRYSRRRGKDGGVTLSVRPVAMLNGEVMFWLVHKVVQRADPSVLPYDEQLSAAAVGAVKLRLLRLAQRQGGGNPSQET